MTFNPFRPLRGNIFSKIVAVFLLSTGILCTISFFYFRSSLQLIEKEGNNQNVLYAQVVSSGISNLKEANPDLSEQQLDSFFNPLTVNKRIISFSILDRDGKIMYGKGRSIIDTPSSSRVSGERIRKNVLTTEQYVDPGTHFRVTDIISPIYIGGVPLEYFNIIFSLEDIYVINQYYYISFGVIALFVALITIFSLYYLFRLIEQPLRKLTEGVDEVSKGNMEHRIVVESEDEIGKVATEFNAMTNLIQASHKQLESYSKDLEKEVEGQTHELKDKVEELERLNRLMVDREITMVEMKKEMESLRREVK